MTYYDDIADGYDELHKEEQLAKLALMKQLDIIEPEDVLLDVGCGTGFSLDYFSVARAVGIDPAEKLVAQYAGKQEIVVGAAEALPFADDAFDVVISVTAVQNFSDIKKGLREIRRVGKNRFIITTLKRSPYFSVIERHIDKVFEDCNIELVDDNFHDTFFVITR